MDASAPAEPLRMAVIAAMHPELRPIVRRFGLRAEPLGPDRIWRGHAGTVALVATVTAMGSEAATRATARLLDAHPVAHVFVVGIAGGVEPGLRIGDLLNPETVVDERSGTTLRPTPAGTGTPKGRLLTSDRLHRSQEALHTLRGRGFLAVDMETAAIGAVAEARGIPWSVFRAISDFAGDPRLDARVLALSRPDGTPDWRAVARFVLARPHRVPQLAKLGAGMQRAIRASTGALCRVLEAPEPLLSRTRPATRARS